MSHGLKKKFYKIYKNDENLELAKFLIFETAYKQSTRDVKIFCLYFIEFFINISDY